MTFYRKLTAGLFFASAIFLFHPTPAHAEELMRGADLQDLSTWRGLVADSHEPKAGIASGRWENMETNNRVQWRGFSGDYSAYDGFSFWVYSDRATNADIAVAVMSEDASSGSTDYYLSHFTVDFTGWTLQTFEFDQMTIMGSPVGTHKIDELRFASTGYRVRNTDFSTVLKFDDFQLLNREELEFMRSQAEEIGQPLRTGELLINDFSDITTFTGGLTADRTDAKIGDQSALWENTVNHNRIISRVFPSDLSEYDGLRIWVWSESPTMAQVAVLIMSDNPASDGQDYYRHIFAINWTGWREIEIPFASMTVTREPLGLSQISSLRFASSGYGAGDANPNTRLRLDGIRAYRSGPSEATSTAVAGRTTAPSQPGANMVAWENDLTDAVQKGTESEKLIFIYAYSETATLNRELERELFSNQSLINELEKFHCYRFNPQDRDDYASFFNILRVPVMMVFDAYGDQVFRLEGNIRYDELMENLQSAYE